VILDLGRKLFEVFFYFTYLFSMGMIDRYKKKGGFSQLLTLIETSGPRKQEQFLGLISQESPAWEAELKKKILTPDRVFTWPQEVLAEVLSRLQPLTLCVSLHGREPQELEKILAILPPITKRRIYDQMAELNPNPAEKATCEMKLVTEVRAIASAGYIKIEKFDSDLFVEENIEDKLNHSDSGLSFLNKIDINYTDDSKSSSKSSAGTSSTSDVGGSGTHSQELDMMKRKVHQLSQENAKLKEELNTVKDKLLQIKRIA
jgi:hypothetical protein